MNQIPVIILGAGGVGRALLRQIVAHRDIVAQRNNLHFNVVAVADSRSWRWQPNALDDDALLQIDLLKANGQAIGAARPSATAIVEQAAAALQQFAILVDVTAEDGMEDAIDAALDHNLGVVLANKKPLAGPYARARRYFEHPYLRHESTVGGGQPVIATVRYLLDTGDTPQQIAGQLSGTLGYICQQFDADVPFSTAVRAAKERGYTEPDPRDDLGGADVMRKVLILARMCGWPLEAGDIQVESLYSRSLAHLSIAEFLDAAVSQDPSFADRVRQARADGNVLRYLADVNADGGTVGLKAVPANSALANMKYISFHTPHYSDEALLIAGKGAGVEMTAAGVHGDMIDLAREMSTGG